MSWQFSSLRNYLVNPDGESDEFTKLSKPPSTSGKSSANSFGLLVNMRALESLEKTLDEVYEQIHIPEERLSSGENSLIVNILSPIRYRSENDLIKTLKLNFMKMREVYPSSRLIVLHLHLSPRMRPLLNFTPLMELRTMKSLK